MKRVNYILVFLISVVLSVSVSCVRDDIELIEADDDDETINAIGNVVDHDDVDDYVWSDSEVVFIELDGDKISVEGETNLPEGDAVSVSESTVTIHSGGTYSISGTLDDGQLIVNSSDNFIVRLILDDASISCSYSAPIYVMSAKMTMIVLAENSGNIISDGEIYTTGDEGPNAAIYSADDLTFYGDGSLSVIGNFNDGIVSKDGLVIASGTISVEAVDDGIRGKDYLVIKSGNISVDSGGDGLKSDNDEDTAKGFISVEAGELKVSVGGDAIAAETDVLISYGIIELESGKGVGSSSTTSTKGIKAGVMVRIDDGSILIDALDDGIHCDEDIEINGGSIVLASGDDGIRSEYNTVINSGDISITKSYEGLESASGSITLNGGQIYIVASDDGINVSAGGASSGGPGHKSVAASSSALNIRGGYLVINNEGDGLDSNGDMDISGGTMIVNSAANNENSSIDCDGTCVVSGGNLIGIGVSRMSQAPSSSSTQYSILIDFNSTLAKGNLIHIEDSEGEEIVTCTALKPFSSFVFSSSELEKGSTYKLYIGGSSTGTEVDGVYLNGTYSGGAVYSSFTISSIITTKNL